VGDLPPQPPRCHWRSPQDRRGVGSDGLVQTAHRSWRHSIIFDGVRHLNVGAARVEAAAVGPANDLSVEGGVASIRVEDEGTRLSEHCGRHSYAWARAMACCRSSGVPSSTSTWRCHGSPMVNSWACWCGSGTGFVWHRRARNRSW
jgi:hypothetical protein